MGTAYICDGCGKFFEAKSEYVFTLAGAIDVIVGDGFDDLCPECIKDNLEGALEDAKTNC